MRLRTTRALVVLVALVLASCSGSSGSDDATSTSSDAAGGAAAGATAPGPESAAAALEDGRAVVDVRTPEEFDAGHVDGAELRDVQDPGFDAALEELDPDGTYVVYCRTGNRSAAAAERMRAAGLDVVDGGSLEDMLAAGWPPAS